MGCSLFCSLTGLRPLRDFLFTVVSFDFQLSKVVGGEICAKSRGDIFSIPTCRWGHTLLYTYKQQQPGPTCQESSGNWLRQQGLEGPSKQDHQHETNSGKAIKNAVIARDSTRFRKARTGENKAKTTESGHEQYSPKISDDFLCNRKQSLKSWFLTHLFYFPVTFNIIYILHWWCEIKMHQVIYNLILHVVQKNAIKTYLSNWTV